MGVVSVDHISFPTGNAERLLEFYRRLGFAVVGEADWRAGRHPVVGLAFGDTKINIHPEELVERRGEPWYLRPPNAEPGCADLCFVWEGGLDALAEHLASIGVDVIAGPSVKTGGRRQDGGRGVSLYLRDPDDNLLEFMSYAPEDLERYAADK